MISSIVLFLSRAIDEIGPAVDAPNALLAPVVDCAAVLSDDVAAFCAAPNRELVGAVVVVAVEAGVAEAVVPVAGVAFAVPAAGVEAVLPKRPDVGLACSVVPVPDAGFPRLNKEVACVLAGSGAEVEPGGLVRLGNAEAGAADVVAAADDADFLSNNEDELAGAAGVVPDPPKSEFAGLAEDASAGFEGCCPNSGLATGVAPPPCAVVGFALNKLEAEEPSAGFEAPKRPGAWAEL